MHCCFVPGLAFSICHKLPQEQSFGNLTPHVVLSQEISNAYPLHFICLECPHIGASGLRLDRTLGAPIQVLNQSPQVYISVRLLPSLGSALCPADSGCNGGNLVPQ